MIIITSLKSGDGKTTVCCVLVCLFKKLSLNVNFIKLGPDYLDCACVGMFCDNVRLNLFISNKNQIKSVINLLTWQVIIEDCLGLFDSLNGVYKQCFLSVRHDELILVLNCESVNSVPVMFLPVCVGVILNNIRSYKHELGIRASLCNVKVLGIMYKLYCVPVTLYLGVNFIYQDVFNLKLYNSFMLSVGYMFFNTRTFLILIRGAN